MAVSKMDEESATEVIKSLGNFGTSTAEKRLEDVANQAARSLGEVGKAAAEKKFEQATLQAVLSLVAIRLAAAKGGGVAWVAVSIKDVIKVAAEKELSFVIYKAVESIGNF